jgi:S-DNA-T family DNA segregation ATPase FtsK/SpoIIIE
MATEVEKKSASKSSSRANEIVAIILLAVTILVFLSLVSFNENDPSLIAASSFKTKNWIGVVGANIAAILFSAIGLTAYVLPAMLALIAWRVFQSASLYVPLGRLIGFLLFTVSISGLLSLMVSSGFRGGIIGAFFAGGFVYLIGNVGATTLLVTLFLTSLLLITNFTYLMLFGGFRMAFENFALRFDDWFGGFKRWRERHRAEAQARLEKRREARTEKEIEEPEPVSPSISLGDVPPAQPRSKPKAKSEEREISLADVLEDTPAGPAEQPKKIEDLRPQIIFGEDPSPSADTEDLPPIINPEQEEMFERREVSDEELAQITITPIRETGELEQIEPQTEPEEDDEDPPVETPHEPPNYENYQLPTSDFLIPSPPRIEQKDEELLAVAKELTEKTAEFNVTGRVMHICQGPVVTTYEFKPDAGVKYSRITGLADDLCLALKAESIRIDRIPGKAYVGIEVPNHNREMILLREVIESRKFRDSPSLLSIALGKTIDGLNYSADLTKMPHLLMAGQTGAGKSVGVNSIIVSILYKAKPDEVKFIMVDPKQVELGIYADIPHLATPIIKDPKRASVALKWAVGQMEKRYKNLAGWGVRNIDGYNTEVKRRNESGQLDENGEPFKNLPYIVIIIDELADLMMVAGKEVEESITRLAQMARAVGIHLVLATQRPSVDVITGLIKANFPSRISFRVSSKVDSRTIIDANGAESLLGRGDMLFLPPGTSNLIRVHGAYVDEKEITKIVDFIKSQGKPDYDTTITKTEEELDDSGDLPGKKDPLFMDALRAVVSAKRASTSGLQRNLRIGYGRAAAILDAMVREGLIGEMDSGTRARPILEKAYEYLEAYDSAGNY